MRCTARVVAPVVLLLAVAACGQAADNTDAERVADADGRRLHAASERRPSERTAAGESPSPTERGNRMERDEVVPDGVKAQLEVVIGGDPGWTCSQTLPQDGLVVVETNGGIIDAVAVGRFAEICVVGADVEQPLDLRIDYPDATTSQGRRTPAMMSTDDIYHGVVFSPTPLAPLGTYEVTVVQGKERWSTEFTVTPAPEPTRARVVEDGNELGVVWKPERQNIVSYPFAIAGAGHQPTELVELHLYEFLADSDGELTYFGDIAQIADADGNWTVRYSDGPADGTCFWIVPPGTTADELWGTVANFCTGS